MRISSIKEQKKGVLSVSLEGGPELTVAMEVAVARGARVGQELTAAEVLELSKADDLYRAHQLALRYLSYRPRAEKEVRDRLRRGGFKIDVVDKEMAKLRELTLVNDAAFARLYREGREASNPRSSRMMRMELGRKGVDREVISSTVEGMDEEAGAYQAASKRARTLTKLGEKEFYLKLGPFLQRRGYGYDLSRRVVERLWQEGHADSA